MEYYAKSVGKCLSKDRVDRIVENTISLINEYDENGYYEFIVANDAVVQVWAAYLP